MTLSLFVPPKSKPSSSSIRGNGRYQINGRKSSIRKRKEAGDYWLGKTLGKGSSGRVKIGYHKITGEKVAVKIISKAYLASNASTEKAVKREIAIMKLIQHPHIVQLINVIDVPSSPNLYLILEYVQGGELFDHLVTRGRLSEKGARKYFQQIILAVDFCHRHLICHRDLKPENLLLDDASNIKIADFGMASLQPNGTLLETSCGSPHYASPEIVAGIPYNGSASDIWSCGVILYALLCGHLPFDDNNIRELLYKVKRGKYSLPSFLSDLAKDLIRKILVVHPDQRLTIQEIQDHEWFKMDGLPTSSILSPQLSKTNQIASAIQDASSIDDRLLDTLKTLWVGHSREQLVDALTSKVYNMEKVAYHLLRRHSTKYWRSKYYDDQENHQCDEDRIYQRVATDGTHTGKKTTRQRRPSSICTSDISPSITPNPILPLQNGNEIYNSAPPPSPDIQRSCFPRKHAMHSTLHPVQLHPINLQRDSSSLRPRRLSSLSVDQKHYDAALVNLSDSNKSKRVSLLATQYQQRQQQQPYSSKSEELEQLVHDHEIATQQPSPGQLRLHSLLQRMDLLYGSFNNEGRSSQLLSPAPSASPTTRKTKNRLSLPLSKKLLPKGSGPTSSINGIPSASHLLRATEQQQTLPTNKPSHIEARPSHPLMCRGSPLLASKARVAPSSPRLEAPTIDSPKLASWFAGLYHFKRPTVYTINCTAKDEKEAFGKIAQVIREQMNGSYTEQKDINGIMQSRAIIDTSCDQDGTRHPQKIQFRLECNSLMEQLGPSGKEIKINFIQQQGDTTTFNRVVELVEKALEEYEKEAEFVSTANGWNL